MNFAEVRVIADNKMERNSVEMCQGGDSESPIVVFISDYVGDAEVFIMQGILRSIVVAEKCGWVFMHPDNPALEPFLEWFRCTFEDDYDKGTV